VEAWAVLYKEKRCIASVACSKEELAAALKNLTTTSSDQVCVAAGINDVELSVDHKYPHPVPPQTGSVILYGSLGSPSLYAFHKKLFPLAKDGTIEYMLRHYPKDSTMETLLQGYGVALDIKNMEYKTIDDSKKSEKGGTASDGEVEEEEEEEEMRDDEDEDEEGSVDEEIDGLVFSNLVESYPSIAGELKTFRDQLVKQHDQADQEIKAWHLQDIGISAAREILDSKHPLKRLRILSQNFPKHARKLAFSRKPLSDDLREEIDLRRNEAVQTGLLNRFLLNGIMVDSMQRSFNIFDFVGTLKKEWSIAKKLAALPLPADEREAMLANIRESKSEDTAARIRVRGPVDGVAPLYLNNIETDYQTSQWPPSVAHLRRPAWNLIFIRKNMYEYVVAFDPTSQQGRIALTQMSFLRMRSAPLQWGVLISTKDLVDAKTTAERDALVAHYKRAEMSDTATGWHFAKLLVMAKDQDKPDEDGLTGRFVKEFVEGVADESTEPTLLAMVDCYLDATGGSFARAANREKTLALLRGDKYDEDVMAMTEYIGQKHLPFESALFNGVLKKDLDLQGDIMVHFGRDQGLYQQMANADELEDDMDLVAELLGAQDAYPAYFSLFSESKSAEPGPGSSSFEAPNHLFANDENGLLEKLIATQVKFVHQSNTLSQPKKQTLLFSANLNDPVHAAHTQRAFKAVQEDLGTVMRVGVIHRLSDEGGVGDIAAFIVEAIGHSDVEAHVQLATESLNCAAKGKTVEATKSKLVGLIDKIDGWKSDAVLSTIRGELANAGPLRLSKTLFDSLMQQNRALDAAQPRLKIGQESLAQLYLNGFRIDLPEQPISDEDIAALISYDMKRRSHAIAKAFIKRSVTYTAEEASQRSMDIVKASAIIDEYRKVERITPIDHNDSSVSIKLDGDESLRVVAYIDPLTEAAQLMSSLLFMLHGQLNATIEVLVLPASDYSEFPLQRFYRYVFDKKTSLGSSVTFRNLPIKPILTMKIDTPEAWNVQIYRTVEDLDNLRVDPDDAADVRAIKTASFRLESLLVYGQCYDKTFDQYSPPNGLQLVLERDMGNRRLHRDTLVMKNYGYFQLQATPGVWNLHLARGRAVELYEIVEPRTDKRLTSSDIVVSSFTSKLEQLLVEKRPGMEMEVLLKSGDSSDSKSSSDDVEAIAADAGVLGSAWNSVMSMFGKKKANMAPKNGTSPAKDVVPTGSANAGRKGETIHVFSLATGHLYERFIKIMMLSVLKRTENPVTFWLLENFLSPDFKDSIPALREKFGMDIRLVTYKWPNWLRQQTQKQRIIWGYKILFLDVLFPLGVQKIIYVDADQVVRADLKELWEMDLQGAPYGYTPFCDSRNVGFQFWRQGYWKDHLRGRPYHISALYVVDLALFRQMAAGDILRSIYDQLSADPNSLSNLDQDLPNYAQHQIKIHSLPQEWLWCESWCSDDSKVTAKTIDLCNNPKHKEPKLDMAKRVISGELFPESWLQLDQEIKDAEKAFVPLSVE
jgi:UDP-glucose:glycoprotein glucosyltransferase